MRRRRKAFHLSYSELVGITAVDRDAFGGFLCYSLSGRTLLSTDLVLIHSTAGELATSIST